MVCEVVYLLVENVTEDSEIVMNDGPNSDIISGLGDNII